MKAAMTLVIELLEPAHVGSADDLTALGPEQIRQVSLRLNSTADGKQGIEAQADPKTTNLGDLVSFARAVQTEPTTIELWFHGRVEAFTL